jgi:undecaprenyl-diphosphatase
MLLWQAIILAIVQGLTEFLPVSSSAHLILLPWLSHGHIPDPGLAFDVALHLGTLIAVVLYFLREWVQLILCGLGFHYPQRAPEHQVMQNRRLFWYLVAGTIPGALVGFLFEHRIEEYLRDPVPIAIAMIVIALLMWYAEYSGRMDRHIEQTSLGDSLIIGTGQALALFPGVSRSGITISCGLFRGMTREAAARFSFLLATPLIAGAAAVEVQTYQSASRWRARFTHVHFGYQRGGFGDCRLYRHRLLFAVFADTYFEDLYLLPDLVWYSRFVARVPPIGLRAIAPAPPGC